MLEYCVAYPYRRAAPIAVEIAPLAISTRCDAGQDSCANLTSKDTAGWILLCLQFQKLHVPIESLQPQHIVGLPDVQKVLLTALAVPSFGDLHTVCGATANEEIAVVAAAFVSGVQHQRKGLIQGIIAALIKLELLEDEEGLPRKMRQLRPEDKTTCALPMPAIPAAEVPCTHRCSIDLVHIKSQRPQCNVAA